MTPEFKIVTYEFGERIPTFVYRIWLYVTAPLYLLIIIPTVYHNITTGYNYWYEDGCNTVTHYAVREKDAYRILWYEHLTFNKAFVTDTPQW